MNEKQTTAGSAASCEARVAGFAQDILKLSQRQSREYQEFGDWVAGITPGTVMNCPEIPEMYDPDWDGIRSVIKTIPPELRALVRTRCGTEIQNLEDW